MECVVAMQRRKCVYVLDVGHVREGLFVLTACACAVEGEWRRDMCSRRCGFSLFGEERGRERWKEEVEKGVGERVGGGSGRKKGRGE